MTDDTIPLIGFGAPDPKTEEDVDKREARARRLAMQLRKLLPADDDVMSLMVLAQLVGNTLAKHAFLGMPPEAVKQAVIHFNRAAEGYHREALRALMSAAAREKDPK